MIGKWLQGLIDRLNESIQQPRSEHLEMMLDPAESVSRARPGRDGGPPDRVAQPMVPAPVELPPARGFDIRSALSHPRDLRQAMVLKEILDKPVALRRGRR
ncbi:MAG: hypothetical protein GKR94_04550 [Gammaproteobacteria bacterium]|nr:hypothetical protein [Gammaproteobacteria bacterium]